MRLIDGLDKVLCRMRRSLMIETLYEVSIVFRKEKFHKCRESIKLYTNLANEKKGIKSLTAFHTRDTLDLLITSDSYN